MKKDETMFDVLCAAFGTFVGIFALILAPFTLLALAVKAIIDVLL